MIKTFKSVFYLLRKEDNAFFLKRKEILTKSSNAFLWIKKIADEWKQIEDRSEMSRKK